MAAAIEFAIRPPVGPRPLAGPGSTSPPAPPPHPLGVVFTVPASWLHPLKTLRQLASRITDANMLSLRSRSSALSVESSRSLLSFQSDLSVASADSSVSALSAGSLLSVGSVGSILSIGSAGSILSIGSAGSILSIRSVGSILSRNAHWSLRSRAYSSRPSLHSVPTGVDSPASPPALHHT